MAEEFIYSQKNNFAGGELTPTIEGRTELGLYQNGVRKLVNFMILPSGGIMRRAGTRFVHLFEGSIPKTMVNVMFSRDLSYLLVFEAHAAKTTCSFFIGGELFVNTITLKHNDRDFHFKQKDFSYCCYQGIAYISFGAKRPIYRFSVDVEVVDEFYQHIKQKARERSEQRGDNRAMALEEEFAATSSADRLAFAKRDQMFIIEPFTAEVSYFKDSDQGSEKPFNEVIYNAEIDEINDELKALHADSDSNIYEQQEQVIYASHVVTFENRLWCFGVNNNIHGLWASYKGDFSDFRMAYKTLLEARNPLTAFSSTFSSATFDNVLWSIPFSSELLIGTTDGIYLAKEGDRTRGEFIRIHKEIDVPVSPIKPVIIGKSVFFVEGDNCKINSLYYSREKGGYQISSITHLAEHIFTCGIRQLVGSNTPFSMLFAVLKNGSFASFTYSEDLKIMGWAQHWLGGNGIVLSIAPVYAKGEDRLYFHVRRNNDIGIGSKEYLEVLHTKYFTAANFQLGNVVYADCHVNVKRAGEHVLSNNIMNSIADDSSHEFRGSITKLEEIIRSQAQNIARLDVTRMTTEYIKHSFKYDSKQLAEYPEQQRQEITEFLIRYYNEYQPKIMEILAASFAFYRLRGEVYARLESIFCTANIDEALNQMPAIKKQIQTAEGLGGDIIQAIEQEVQNWTTPEILRSDGTGSIIEYINNDAFSFNPLICVELKNLNIELISNIFTMTTGVLRLVEEVQEQQLEKAQELAEMLGSVAKLNKKMLLYYANRDNDNKQDLAVSIKKFFGKNQNQTIDFYSSLKDISHPTLTKYLYGNYIKQWLLEQTAVITAESSKEEIEQQISSIAANLIEKLEEKHAEDCTDEIASFKRRSEILQIITEAISRQDLSALASDYIGSNEFKELIDTIIDQYEFGILSSSSNSLSGIGSDSGNSEDSSDSSSNVEAGNADIAGHHMQYIQTALKQLKRQLLEYCPMIIVNQHKTILKDIIEDENNIKLEKYLLLSTSFAL